MTARQLIIAELKHEAECLMVATAGWMAIACLITIGGVVLVVS